MVDFLKKYWGWLVAGVVALVVLLVAWKLHRQKNKIAALEADVAEDQELAKDLLVKAQAAKNADEAKQLTDEANKILADIVARQALIAQKQAAADASQKKIDDMKTWAELDNEAKGGR